MLNHARAAKVICPQCRTEDARRSKRRGVKDAVYSWFGTRPWRCKICNRRFHAWTIPVELVAFAHCPRCGNVRLQRVGRDRAAHGIKLAFAQVFQLPAYRCDPCRLKFFTIRPVLKILSKQPVAKNEEDASGETE
jgi:hypothetical protein